MNEGGERCVYFLSSSKFFSALDATRLPGALLTVVFVSREDRVSAFPTKFQEAVIRTLTHIRPRWMPESRRSAALQAALGQI